MIFAVQRFLEDYLRGKGLNDPDQYAVKVANLYESKPGTAFRSALAKIKTPFFRANPGLKRRAFEDQVATTLARKFKKKRTFSTQEFPGGVEAEARALQKKRKTIRQILDLFRHATEARGIEPFWVSRKKRELRERPEAVGGGQLLQFIYGLLHDSKGLVLSEVGSGVGWVDVVVILSNIQHLIELKVLTGNRLKGPSQLAKYMATERREEGWLVIFDARPSPKEPLPKVLAVGSGRIHVIAVDINPIPPSKLT